MRNNRIAAGRGRVTSSPGSPIKDLYASRMLENGIIILEKTGTQNTDEVIQSYFESTDLHMILTRYLNGDPEAISQLNQFKPIYMDLTTAPKHLAEALQTINNSRSAFDALPVDIKRQFDNDFNQWLASAGSPDWLKVMDPLIKSSTEVVASSEAPRTAKLDGVVAPLLIRPHDFFL